MSSSKAGGTKKSISTDHRLYYKPKPFKNATNKSSWRKWFVKHMQTAKNGIFSFFDGWFTSKDKDLSSFNLSATKVNDNLLTSTLKITTKDKNIYIKALLDKGFSKKEANTIVKQKLATSSSIEDITNALADIPESKYYLKYSSIREISRESYLALKHLKEIGYSAIDSEKFIQLKLDACKSLSDFKININSIPTFHEHELGYTESNAVKLEKKDYINVLLAQGYDIYDASSILTKIYDNVHHKSEIIDEIYKIPTVKMLNQGYTSNKEYYSLTDYYAGKLGELKIDPKKANNIVVGLQESTTSKNEFIKKIQEEYTILDIPQNPIISSTTIEDIAPQANIEELQLEDKLTNISKKIEELIFNCIKKVDKNSEFSRGYQATTNLLGAHDKLERLVNDYIACQRSLADTADTEDIADIMLDQLKFILKCNDLLESYIQMYKKDLSSEKSEPLYKKNWAGQMMDKPVYQEDYDFNLTMLKKQLNKIDSLYN